jgi:2-ketocyclohexanecarboxyl-CoA hydrolase
MNFSHILFEKTDHRATITFNHPERHNAFDFEMMRELIEALENIEGDKTIGVVVITGTGEGFCSGGYIKDFHDTAKVKLLYNNTLDAFLKIRRLRQPVIAAVNGYAVGGGNELVIACDLAIASERAQLGQAGPRIGSSPVIGGNNMLSLVIGEKKAKEVCFLCELYSADAAESMGWVNKVVPHERLYEEVDIWCEKILNKSPKYLEITKISSNVWWDMLHHSFFEGMHMLRLAAGSEEMLEAAQAFLEKRKPDFNRFRS